MNTKKCPNCQSTRYDGLSVYCKDCYKILNKTWKVSKRIYNSSAILRNLVNTSRRRAKERGLDHSINVQDLKDMLVQQDNKCALTGIPLSIEPHPKFKGKRIAPPNRVSVDRIDNKKGYTVSNIQLVCDFANRVRSYLSVEQFIGFCILVSQHYTNNLTLREGIEAPQDKAFQYLLTM